MAPRWRPGGAVICGSPTIISVFLTIRPTLPGEAVRRLDPTYVRTVDTLGIWNGRSSGAPEPLLRLKAPLEDTWLPYLAGRGTRDEALAAAPRQNHHTSSIVASATCATSRRNIGRSWECPDSEREWP
jgi:hypothetical protein